MKKIQRRLAAAVLATALVAGVHAADEVDLAQLARNRREWPAEVALTANVAMPLKIGGFNSGSADLPPGTKVKLLEVRGETLLVGYGSSSKTVPATATDLAARVLAARQLPSNAATPSDTSAPAAAVRAGAVTTKTHAEKDSWFMWRLDPLKRAARLQQEGGNDASERAVVAALRWLKENQRPDGFWDCAVSDVAGTSLATLALLGHGETDKSPEFGATIQKAIDALISTVGADGIIAGGNMYCQGQVVEALSEAYAILGYSDIREVLDRAVAVIVRAQDAEKSNPRDVGGWRYSPSARDSDLSVSGWQIMALKLAVHARDRKFDDVVDNAIQQQWGVQLVKGRIRAMSTNGTAGPREFFAVPQTVFDQAMQYIWNLYGHQPAASTTGFGYTGPSPTPSMTGVGILCAQFLGHGNDERVKASLLALRDYQTEWGDEERAVRARSFKTPVKHEARPRILSRQHGDFYTWYFVTQALFQGGGAGWQDWNKQMRNMLVEHQERDGHWPLPQHSGFDVASPVYATAIGALILETYYRYPRVALSDSESRR